MSRLPSLTLFATLLCSTAAHAGVVTWVDWTSTSTTEVFGTLTVDGAVIDVTYTGERSFAQTSGGTNYWNPSSPYISATVDNAPPASDIIALRLATAKTLAFSEPVTNPLFAVVSLNGNGYRFDRDFQILSFGAGYWGNGTLTKTITTHPDGSVTYDLIGSGEPHGVIQFLGTFSTVNWTSLSNENWNGFSIAVENLASAVPPEITVLDGATPGAQPIFDEEALIDFGDQQVEGAVTRSLTIVNDGTGPLNFSGIELTGADGFTVSALPLALAAGDSVEVELTFDPAGEGTFDTTLAILSDDLDEGSFEIALTGSLRDADRDGLPDAQDFMLEVDQPLPGTPFELRVRRAPPGAAIALVGSLTGTGEGPCVPGSTVCVDLANAVILRRGFADAQGSLTASLITPPGVNTFWLQALWFEGATASGDVTPVVNRSLATE
jgi:hypothetical protein